MNEKWNYFCPIFQESKLKFLYFITTSFFYSTTGNSPKKKAGRPKKLKQEKITEHVTVKKRKVDRFKGMSEEEVVKRLLPDHLAPNLDIVIVSSGLIC